MSEKVTLAMNVVIVFSSFLRNYFQYPNNKHTGFVSYEPHSIYTNVNLEKSDSNFFQFLVLQPMFVKLSETLDYGSLSGL